MADDQNQDPDQPLDQDKANFAQRTHQGLDQYLGGVKNLAPKTPAELGEMALDATPIVGNVRSAQRGYEAAQEHDWLGAALGAVGAIPLLGGMTKLGAKTEAALQQERLDEHMWHTYTYKPIEQQVADIDRAYVQGKIGISEYNNGLNQAKTAMQDALVGAPEHMRAEISDTPEQHLQYMLQNAKRQRQWEGEPVTERERTLSSFPKMSPPKDRQSHKYGGSISDKTYALLHRIKRQDGGSTSRKGSFQAPSRLSILKDVYPELVPPSGSWIPKGGNKPEDPTQGHMRALDMALRYNAPSDARESTNVEDRRFTHPSLPVSDMGNYHFLEYPSIAPLTHPAPPSSAAGVQGMAGAQSGPSATRGPWMTSMVAPSPFETQVVPSTPQFKHGGSISDATRNILAKLKNRT